MLLIIGQDGCDKCDIAINKINNKSLKYEYKKLNELDSRTRIKYIQMARKAGQLETPIVIDNNKVVKLDNVLGEK